MRDSHHTAEIFHITATDQGPYIVYGRPPLAQQIIRLDLLGECWFYEQRRTFSSEAEPTALCRCGASHAKPYCDGSHMRANWDHRMIPPMEHTIIDTSEVILPLIASTQAEFEFEPSIAILEDPQTSSSSGLWIKGGITIGREDGSLYHTQNRVVLCRCGASRIKPFCDGTHATIHWQDEIKEITPQQVAAK